jgi:hypothetical protein
MLCEVATKQTKIIGICPNEKQNGRKNGNTDFSLQNSK